MIRLVLIAIASFVIAFVLATIVFWLTGSHGFAPSAAFFLGLIATPIALLRVWPVSEPSLNSEPLMNRPYWGFIIASLWCLWMLFILWRIGGWQLLMWLLIVILLLVGYVQLKWRVKRRMQLSRRGYFSGRLLHDQNIWVYEELRNDTVVSLSLKVDHTEPGHWELFFPDKQEWKASVPEWASDRRVEIAVRVSEGWKARDFHFPNDLKIRVGLGTDTGF